MCNLYFSSKLIYSYLMLDFVALLLPFKIVSIQSSRRGLVRVNVLCSYSSMLTVVRYFSFVPVLLISLSMDAQNRAKFDFEDGAPLYRILDRAEDAFGVKVYYHPDHIPTYAAYISNDSINLLDLFQQVATGTSLQFVKYSSSSYVAAPVRFQNKAYADEVVDGWKKGRYRSPDDEVASTLRFVQGSDEGQEGQVVFSGKVLDEETGDPLYGVTLFHPELAVGTTTDLGGIFSLALPAGEHVLTLRLLGYLEQPIRLELYAPGSPVTIALIEQAIAMDEVVVSARSGERALRDRATGIQRISARELKQLPTLAGELNVLQSLTTQAGVSQTSEGSSAITVRGGGLDQNLVLQGGMAILYPAHALGFFPVFHPDLVAGVELYKGYIPARFGGRSTSVIDVAWKTGDYKKWSMQAGTGFFSSRLCASGPILKDKVSLIVGGRFSHLNYLLKTIISFLGIHIIIFRVELRHDNASLKKHTSLLKFQPASLSTILTNCEQHAA